MGKHCCIKGCDSGSRPNVRKLAAEGKPQIPSFFCKDKALLEKWNEKSPTTITEKSRVCARHFDHNDVKLFDKFRLKDGTVAILRRKVPSLVPGAVARYFGSEVQSWPIVPPDNVTDISSVGSRTESQLSSPKENESASIETNPLLPETPSGQASAYQSPKTPSKDASMSFSSWSHYSTATSDMSEGAFRTPATTPARSSLLNAPLVASTPAESMGSPQMLSTASPYSHYPHSFNFLALQTISMRMQLPGVMWGVHKDPGKVTAFVHLNNDWNVDRKVIFKNNLQPIVFLNEKRIQLNTKIQSIQDIHDLLHRVNGWRLCVGYRNQECRQSRWARDCTGYIPVRPGKKQFLRCSHCAHKSKEEKRQQKKHETSNTSFVEVLRKKVKSVQQSNRRNKKRVSTLKQTIRALHAQAADYPIKKLDETIASDVPLEQQELVRSVFHYARVSPKGRRYTHDWMYDCLLMKIRGPALYRKLRRENKLPLPSIRTLNRFIKNLRPEWGFQENTFEILKEKAKYISESDRHGTLLLDEMALTERVAFQGDSLKVHGLVNLGKYTPDEDKTKRGDHALVLMFQPFRGQWVQTVGAFLSAGAVKGPVLQKLVLEGTLQLENAGFHVDCVTTDAATWNRSMWTLFGVNKSQNSCQHPVDPTRNLCFASDFPHLIKSIWTRIVNNKELKLPEGTVKLSHYTAVVELEEGKGIRAAFPLTRDHLKPTNYQKMNVRMAMQFFSNTVSSAMDNYRIQGKPGLEDSLPTITFMRRINSVVEAMNSRSPVDGLRPDPESTQHKVLTDFLLYLDEMEILAGEKAQIVKDAKLLAENFKRGKENLPPKAAKKQKAKPPSKTDVGHVDELTTSVYVGLVVTIKGALELTKYLHDNHNYQYLMTRRINQDALEHFFGQVRSSCGSGDHPDPLMFIQVYRLLSTYSLVKPPRGSNISGGDLLGTLVQLKDLIGQGNAARRNELEEKLFDILDGDVSLVDSDVNTDIRMCEQNIDESALTMFGGYITRKARDMKPAKDCKACFESLHAPADRPSLSREGLVDIISYGGLLKPSDKLYALVKQLEGAILSVTAATSMHSLLIFDILEGLTSVELERVGCEEHSRGLTAAVASFYLTCRMHFTCADANKKSAEKKRKKRELAKIAKQA